MVPPGGMALGLQMVEMIIVASVWPVGGAP